MSFHKIKKCFIHVDGKKYTKNEISIGDNLMFIDYSKPKEYRGKIMIDMKKPKNQVEVKEYDGNDFVLRFTWKGPWEDEDTGKETTKSLDFKINFERSIDGERVYLALIGKPLDGKYKIKGSPRKTKRKKVKKVKKSKKTKKKKRILKGGAATADSEDVVGNMELIYITELLNKCILSDESNDNDIISDGYVPVELLSIEHIIPGAQASALILIVKMKNGKIRVIKLEIQENDTREVVKEYKIQDSVNSIREDISPKLFFLKNVTEIGEVKNILEAFAAIELLGLDHMDIGEFMPKFLLRWMREGRNLNISLTMMELINGKTLSYVVDQDFTGLSKNAILEDLRNKINLIHANGIYHCDLHMDNVLVLDDNTIRIIDFGSSILSEDETSWKEIYCPGNPEMREAQKLIDDNCGLNGSVSCL